MIKAQMVAYMSVNTVILKLPICSIIQFYVPKPPSSSEYIKSYGLILEHNKSGKYLSYKTL